MMRQLNLTPSVFINGFTLIECLLTLVILVSLLSIGVTGYQHLIARNKTSVYLNELITTLYYARSEALKQHLPVAVCGSSDAQRCNGRWRDGWLIFINPQNREQPESARSILRVHAALPARDQLNWGSTEAKNDRLQFNALGNARQAGTFVYCPHNNPQYAGIVVISLTGRVRAEQENIDKNICAKNS